MRSFVLSMVVLLASFIPAAAFEKSGYLDRGIYYSDLEIVPGVPEPLNTGGISGQIRYVSTYLLSGTIENAEGRNRSNIQMRFTATDCSGTKSYWAVVVNVGPLGPYESFMFLKFISNVDPGRPCQIQARAYGD